MFKVVASIVAVATLADALGVKSGNPSCPEFCDKNFGAYDRRFNDLEAAMSAKKGGSSEFSQIGLGASNNGPLAGDKDCSFCAIREDAKIPIDASEVINAFQRLDPSQGVVLLVDADKFSSPLARNGSQKGADLALLVVGANAKAGTITVQPNKGSGNVTFTVDQLNNHMAPLLESPMVASYAGSEGSGDNSGYA